VLRGLTRVSDNKAGLTLVEVLVSILLMVVVFLGVSALYVASQTFYFNANDKITISSELQYAAEHIYKNVMRAVGDEAAAPGSRPLEVPNPSTLYITINNNTPITKSNYNSTVTYTYSKSDDNLLFDDGSAPPPESIAPKVTITDVSFELSGNILTIALTGSYRAQTLTFYSACYPQLSSFR
jgi:Tfp pilus assembly protein PilV